MPKGGDLYFTLVPDHKHIQLYIKDTGVGMDQEQVKRLGSPFYSTKEKGTGLGMMVVFSVVQAMNGKIDIISEKRYRCNFLINFSTHTKKRDEILITFFLFLQLIQQKLSLFHVVFDFLYVLSKRALLLSFYWTYFSTPSFFLSVVFQNKKKNYAHMKKKWSPTSS